MKKIIVISLMIGYVLNGCDGNSTDNIGSVPIPLIIKLQRI